MVTESHHGGSGMFEISMGNSLSHHDGSPRGDPGAVSFFVRDMGNGVMRVELAARISTPDALVLRSIGSQCAMLFPLTDRMSDAIFIAMAGLDAGIECAKPSAGCYRALSETMTEFVVW